MADIYESLRKQRREDEERERQRKLAEERERARLQEEERNKKRLAEELPKKKEILSSKLFWSEIYVLNHSLAINSIISLFHDVAENEWQITSRRGLNFYDLYTKYKHVNYPSKTFIHDGSRYFAFGLLHEPAFGRKKSLAVAAAFNEGKYVIRTSGPILNVLKISSVKFEAILPKNYISDSIDNLSLSELGTRDIDIMSRPEIILFCAGYGSSKYSEDDVLSKQEYFLRDIRKLLDEHNSTVDDFKVMHYEPSSSSYSSQCDFCCM